MESLISKLSIADLVAKHDSILSWLMSRGLQKESTVSQNKQYATEVLAILLQSSAKSRQRFIDLDGPDSFLQALSAYRKRDPMKGTEEEEFVENLFDCVTCIADDPEGKQKFLDAEGIELCLIMLKEGKMSRPRSIRLLDHALGGPYGGHCCERFVEAAGLKPTFTAFMKKVGSRYPDIGHPLTPYSKIINLPSTALAYSPLCFDLYLEIPLNGFAS